MNSKLPKELKEKKRQKRPSFYEKKLVSIGKAAELLNVSVDTIRRWDKSGKLHSTRINGKDRYFSIEEIERINLEKPLSISEASQRLGLSATTLRRLDKSGVLKTQRDGNGERIYSQKSLQDFISSEYYLSKKKVQAKILAPLSEAQKAVELLDAKAQKTPKKIKAIVKMARREATEDRKLLQDMLTTVSWQRRNIKSLLEFRRNIYFSGASLAVASTVLVVLITFSFLLYPKQTAEFLGYSYREDVTSFAPQGKGASLASPNAQKQGIEGSVVGVVLRPISQVSLGIVKQVSPDVYERIEPENAPVQNIAQVVSQNGQVVIMPEHPIVLPNSSYLKLEDSALVSNLNAEYLNGQQVGEEAGNIAAFSENGIINGLVVYSFNLAAESVTSAKIANGTIGSEDISPDVIWQDIQIGQISSSNKIQGSAVQLSSGGGLTNNSGLSLLTNCSANQVLVWNGTTWNCANQSGGGGSVSGVSSLNGLAGTLEVAGSGINSVSASGTTITISGTEADTLASVTARGASTTAAVSLGGGATIANGLTVSSGSVSFPSASLANAYLENSSLTINTGTGLSGGGEVSLGSSISLVVSALTAANFTAGDFSSVINEGTYSIGILGNAATATKLETARTINGVSFDGSGNITVPAAAATLTGNTLASGVTASSLTSVGTLTGLNVSGGAILATGTTGDIPVTGAGTRFMWVPSLGAIRAGTVTGTQWDSIGANSTAFGYNTSASGTGSTAIGYSSSATQDFGVSLGYSLTNAGYGSVLIGAQSSTNNTATTGVGWNNTVNGYVSTAVGFGNNATGDFSLALGYANQTTNANSIAIGNSNVSSGTGSIALGNSLTVSGNYSGGINLDNTPRTISTNNVFAILGGNVGIGNASPVGKFDVSGAVTGKALAILNETGDSDILTASASGSTRFTLTHAGQLLLPVTGSGGGLVLGGDANLYRSAENTLKTDGNLVVEGALTLNGDVVLTGDILPTEDNTYSLGSASFQWKDVYIGPGSLYINGQKVIEESSGNDIVVSADEDQSLVIQTSGTGNVDLNPTDSGQVLLRGNVQISGGKLFRTTDGTNVQFSDGIKSGNLTVDDNAITATNLNGGISLTPAGNGGVYITSGNLGIGTTAPDKKVEVNLGTSNAFRLSYNDGDGSAENYADLTISSGGNLGLAPSGGSTNITGNLIISSGLSLNSQTFTNLLGSGLTNSSGTLTVAGLTASNLTAGDFSLKINSGTYSINISGNAGTVTNGVYTTGAGTVYLAPNGNGSQLTGLTGSQISGNISGNAATATKLETARTINGVSFDGSGNITVPAAAATLTGNTLASGVTASSLTSVGTLTSLGVSGNVGIGAAASEDYLLGLSATSPEQRLITSEDDNYARLTRTTTQLAQYNKVLKPGANYSLTFNSASSQRVDIAASSGPLRATTAVTVSLWVKRTSGSGQADVVSFQDYAGAAGYRLWFSNGNTICFGVAGTGGAGAKCASSGISQNSWHHVAAVYNGSTVQIYTDGSANGTAGSVTTTSMTYTQNNFRIGGFSAADLYFFDGGVEDARVYARALSSGEISTLADGGDPSSTDLAGEWKLNEGSGTSAADASNNGYTGTLVNSPTWSTDVPSQNPAPTAGSYVEVTAFKVQDGGSPNQEGIQTFGWSNGETVLRGSGLKFVYGGSDTEAMRISSTGNLGIGNTNPVGKVDVSGKIVGKALTILNETGDQAVLTASASGTTVFTIAHSGQVQIPTIGSSAGLLIGGDTQLFRGTTDRLDLASGDSLNIVNGNITLPTNGSKVGQDTSANYLTWGSGNLDFNASGQNVRINLDTDNDSTSTGFRIYKNAANGAGTELFTFLEAGSFGIGTNTPQENLEIGGSAENKGITIYPTSSSNYGFIRFSAGASDDSSTDRKYELGYSGDTGNFYLGEGGNQATFYVTSAGDIGLGGQLALNDRGSDGGIVFGGDSNLYSPWENALWTDDALWVANSSLVQVANRPFIYSNHTGDPGFGGGIIWQQEGVNQLEMFYDSAQNALLLWDDNASNSRFQVTRTGNVNIGNGGIDVNNRLNIFDDTNTSTSGSHRGLLVQIYEDASDESTGRAWGLQFVTGTKSGNASDYTDGLAFVGNEGKFIHNGTGTIQGGMGALIFNDNTSTGTVVNDYGLIILTPGNGGGGHVVNSDLIHLDGQVAFDGNNERRVGLYVSAQPDPGSYTGTTVAGIQLAGTSGTYRDGILFGTDTNLYRSAADTLKTDDKLVVGGQIQAPTEGSGGGILIGGDTQLYRLGADFLFTPDTFEVGGNFKADFTLYIGADGYIQRTATNTLQSGNNWIMDGNLTLGDIPSSGNYTHALCWDNDGASQIQDCVGSAAADYMEMYSVEGNVLRGDIVATSGQYVTTTTGERIAKLVKSDKPYQDNLIGIVSDKEKAGDFNSIGYNIKEEDNPQPIALVGRVKLRVSSENGSIKTGDYITSSTTAGVGMKATAAGRVVAKALEDFDVQTQIDCPEGTDSSLSCGEIMVFVTPMTYTGQSVELAMKDKGFDILGENSEEAEGTVLTGEELDKKNEQILSFLESDASKTGRDIYVDRIASGEVISPNIITNLLIAKKIKADSIEGLEILTDKIGTLSGQIAQLENQASTSATVPSLDLKVLGDLTAEKGLTVLGPAEFKGNTLFAAIAEFIGSVIFRGEVKFEGRPTFNKDTGGVAIVKEGGKEVAVVFEKEYEKTPIVTASIAFDKDSQGEDIDSVLTDGISYVIVNKDTKGFTIKLNKPAVKDVSFSWTALSVDNVTTTVGQAEASTPTPSPTLTPTPAQEPVEPSPVETPTPVASDSGETQ